MTETRAATGLPRSYVLASVVTLGLAAIASAVGLFVPDVYRDAPVLVLQARGQDLLTLVVALPALVASLYFAVRGSRRASIVWLGVTGYLLYTYASYSFMAAFNELYLVYVAVFGLSLFTLVGGLVRFDAAGLKRAVRDRPVRAYVAFQALLAVLVALLWLSEIIPATFSGGVPPSNAEADLPVNVIHSLDLGVVLPAFALSAYWLRQRRAWGYVFTGVLLVKGTTLGLAVLAMIAVVLRDGQPVPLPQLVVFGAITLLGLALTGRFVLSIDSGGAATSPDRTDRPAGDLR